jgi:hypothetical protein
MPLTISDCSVTTTTIRISFSDAVFTDLQVGQGAWEGPLTAPKKTDPDFKKKEKAYEQWRRSALNPYNFGISSSSSVDFSTSLSIGMAQDKPLNPAFRATPTAVTKNSILITFIPSTGSDEFQAGNFVTIAVSNIEGYPEAGDSRARIDGNIAMVSRQVPGGGSVAAATRNAEDALSYPILTEEVSYPPAALQRPGGGAGVGGGGRGGAGSFGLGETANDAIANALGWKPNAGDPRGFLGALTQSFSLTESEGHVEATWNPRSYTVQSDLAGGISGAQASLLNRAQDVGDKCLPLLDGLYPLNPDADPEYVTALREMAKSQITEIIRQFSEVPPSILRVDLYFKILLGYDDVEFVDGQPTPQTDPDRVGGTLGDIRREYGIFFLTHDGKDNPFSNSLQDEKVISDFRVTSDYLTSLLLTWLSNRKYFELTPSRLPAFLGTQLVLISRQLNVIAETVNEVRFALDSVFIGPNERQTLLIEFPIFKHLGHGEKRRGHLPLPAMYLEDVLTEIYTSVADELPRLMRDGGRIAINNNVLPVMQTLKNMAEGAKAPTNINSLPAGFSTARVRNALSDLSDQLAQLLLLGQQVGMQFPRTRYSMTP